MKKFQLFHVIILINLTLFVFSGIMLHSTYFSIKKELLNKNVAEIKTSVDALNKSFHSFIGDVMTSIGYLSEIDDVIQLNEKGKTLLKKFYDRHKHRKCGSPISTIKFISSTGQILFSYPQEKFVGFNVSGKKIFQKLRIDRSPVISNVSENLQGDKIIAAIMPVFNNQKLIGFISITIPFDYFKKSFLASIQFSEDSETYIIDKKGKIVFSEETDEIGKNFYEIPKHYFKYKDIFDLIKSDSSCFINFSYELDDQTIQSYAYMETLSLPGNSWRVFLEIPSEAMFASLEELTAKFSSIGVGLILIIFFAFIAHTLNVKKSTAILLEREQVFQTISQNTGQIAFEYDVHLRKVKLYSNVSKLLGYENSEIANIDRDLFKEFIHPEDLPQAEKLIEEAIKNKAEKLERRYRLRKKSGEYIYVEETVTIIYDNSGNPSKVLGTIKDISDKIAKEKELEQYRLHLEELVQQRTEELEKTLSRLRKEINERIEKEKQLEKAKKKIEAANKMKTEFLAQMSHEIRTPLNVILSHLSLLQFELEDTLDEELHDSINAISKASERIIRTIDLILNMTDVITGGYEAKFQLLDIHDDILRKIFVNSYPKAQAKNIAFVLHEPEGDPNVTGDEYSLQQIFDNLVDNAIKYTEKGKVEIRSYRNDNDKLVVEISDTGIGMDKEYLPYLFEPFSQEDQGYTRKFEGNGLGMALVKEYSKINDIDIEIDTEKGKGTTFRLIFNKS